MFFGKFVCIDGANGSGKSTVIAELAKLLTDKGFDVVVTKEPTTSKLGQFIRAEQDNLAGFALAHLVTADRYDHIANVIRPNLEKGKLILTDRYLPSSMVYQVIDGLESDYLWVLNKYIIWPDLFIYISAKPNTIATRLSSRDHTTRFEHLESIDQEVSLYQQVFHMLIANGYKILQIDNDQHSVFESALIAYEAISQLYATSREKP